MIRIQFSEYSTIKWLKDFYRYKKLSMTIWEIIKSPEYLAWRTSLLDLCQFLNYGIDDKDQEVMLKQRIRLCLIFLSNKIKYDKLMEEA